MMEDIIYDVLLNMKMGKVLDTNYRLCQGDYGHTLFQIRVFDGEKEILNPEQANIVFRKSNNAVVMGDLDILSTGYKYKLKGNEIDFPGPVIADIKIRDSTGRTSTSRFKFEAVLDTENGEIGEGGPYINELEKMLAEAQAIVDQIQDILASGNYKGDKGDKGDTATIAVGAVTASEPGSNPQVINSGTDTDAVFDFVLPRGEKGDPGSGSVETVNPEEATEEDKGKAADAYHTGQALEVLNGKINNVINVSPSDFLTLGNNVALDTPFYCKVKNGKVCLYIMLVINSAISGIVTIFTVKESYRPLSYYHVCPARKSGTPYSEKGTVWINCSTGVSTLYGTYSAGEKIYIQTEYMI